MIRKTKALGLAVVAVLAMSAVVASAAQATPEFNASAFPATATGSNTAGSEEFITEGGTVECDSHFEGSLAEASSTLSITPKYTNCVAFGFVSATVEMEGCTYLFHATEKVSAGVYKSHVDVVCPEGKSIKIKASTCSAEVKAQTGLTTTKSTNSGGSVVVNPEVGGIAYTVTNDGFLCPFNGKGAKTGGEYKGQVTISRVGGGSIEVSGE